MGRFDRLTQYIPMIASDSIGNWVVDEENDGTPVHPIQMPYVTYTIRASFFRHPLTGIVAYFVNSSLWLTLSSGNSGLFRELARVKVFE